MQCPTCDATNIPGADQCAECQTNLMQEDLPVALPVTEFERDLLGHTVGDLAPRAGVTIGEGASLGAAVSLLRDEHIGCVIVTGEQGRLRGILSERDILRACALHGASLEKQTVRDHMTAAPDTVRLDHPLAHALHCMAVGEYRHLPLVHAGGKPAGIISSRDVVNHVGARLAQA